MSIPEKLKITAILCIVLSISIQIPLVHSEETLDTSEVLHFLNNVANVDVSKYEPKLVVTTSENPPDLGGISIITGKYILESLESTISVLFDFRNYTLCYCAAKVVEGKIYQREELSPDVKVQTDAFLQSYRSYTADSTIEVMRSLLDAVDVTHNNVTVEGNMKLEVRIYPSYTSLSWKNTFNGADYPGLSVSFGNGTFGSFRDDRSYFKISGVDVNLSKEEAVELALRYGKDLSWKLLDGTEVTDFTIVEGEIGTELLTGAREPLTLYPYWIVILPLDKMYPGFVTYIQFQVWADTGEVIECIPLGSGGEVPMEVFPTKSPHDDSNIQIHSLILIAALATPITVGVTLVALKNKRRKTPPFSTKVLQ